MGSAVKCKSQKAVREVNVALQFPSQTTTLAFGPQGRTSDGLGTRLPAVLDHMRNIFWCVMVKSWQTPRRGPVSVFPFAVSMTGWDPHCLLVCTLPLSD